MMTKPADVIDTQRLDKWLWHARIVKSRSLASQLVMKGKFRINREKISKASYLVKPGDVITAAIGGRVRILQIVGFSARRGPAAEARLLYLDLTPADDRAPRAASQAANPERVTIPDAADPAIDESETGQIDDTPSA